MGGELERSRAQLSLDAAQRYAEHVNPAFVRLLGALGRGRVFVRAKGTSLFDADGDEYLDCVAGGGSVNLGHNPDALLERVREMLGDDAPAVVHGGVPVHAASFAASLAELTSPLTRVLLSTTGSEAVESAVKLARAATKRKPILYCKGGFHGTGLGALSILGSGRLRDPFEPLVGECYEIPFDDLAALAKALGERKHAAFVVEPIQAEAGVVVPHKDYLREARALCAKSGALFVLDEVRTGLGRTGSMFAFQDPYLGGFVPDVLVLGESLGGGLVPFSCAVTTPDIHDRAYGRLDRSDMHGSTFSGWALGSRVALATLELARDQALADAAKARGEQLLDRLRDALDDHPFVTSVRGRGLLVGIELGPAKAGSGGGLLGRLLPGVVDLVSRRVFGQWLAVCLLERGIVTQPASLQWNVLQVEPPLTVTEAEIDRVAETIADVLGRYRDLRAIVTDAGQRLGTQVLSSFSS
jgi:putrescine aminotransferase